MNLRSIPALFLSGKTLTLLPISAGVTTTGLRAIVAGRVLPMFCRGTELARRDGTDVLFHILIR